MEGPQNMDPVELEQQVRLLAGTLVGKKKESILTFAEQFCTDVNFTGVGQKMRLLVGTHVTKNEKYFYSK